MSGFTLRRAGIYYFRRVVPFDLRRFFPKSEIWISLRTTDKTTAKIAARRKASTFDDLVLRIRGGFMDDSEIKQLVRNYFAEQLTHIRRVEAHNHLPLHKAKERRESKERMLTEGIDSCKRQYLDRLHGSAEIVLAVDRMLEKYGFSLVPNSPEYNRACRYYLMGQIEYLERLLAESKGDFSHIEPLLGTASLANQTISIPEKHTAILISTAIETYEQQLDLTKKIDPTTRAEYARAYRLLPEIVGDKPIEDVTRDDVRTVLATLQRLPAHSSKKKETRDKSILEAVEIAARLKLKLLSPAAIEKNFQRIKSFLLWACQEGLTEKNCADGIVYHAGAVDKRNDDEARDAYTAEDIARLVDGLIAERASGTFDKHPERYWLPLIALLAGSRTEELAQLHLEDILEVDGIPCINITTLYDEDGEKVKRVKGNASKRCIPIHPALIALGFVDWVDSEIRAKKQPRLWMALNRQANGKFHRNFANWYNGTDNQKGFRKVYISTSDKKPFYSLRHTFMTALKHMLTDERVINEIVGHSQQTLSAGTYGKRFPASMLYDVVAKVDYGVDFVGKLGRWPWRI